MQPVPYKLQPGETIIRNMIKKYLRPVNQTSKIDFIIYYRKFKTANIILNNNPSKKTEKVAQTNLVYEFTCPIGICDSDTNSHIGYTTTLLSRRLSCHLSRQSTIKTHLEKHKLLN